MAEAAALAAMRWIASPIITKFIKHASTYLGKDVAHELEDLETIILPQFQLVIEVADKSTHRGKLELWLRKLKAAFHDAEDLLDEREYDILKREAEKGKRAPSMLASSSNAVLKPLRAASIKMSNFHSKNRKLLIKLDELKKVLAEAKNFHDLLGLKAGNTLERTGTAQIGPQTNVTSLPTSKVFGRDKDRDHIIHLLCKPNDAERILPAGLNCKNVISLENMEDSEFLALFNEYAFSGAKIRDPQLYEKLGEIAEKIAERLGQSPLAAKAVGSQLSRRKDIVAWTAALNEKLLSEPTRALLWSFEKLDPSLQRCFLYCSLFPKGHKYIIDELVHLWVAEGLVESRNQNRTMEDIGRNYINQLVSVSFFQSVYRRHNGTSYIIHDLLHDLAESLSSEECFRLEDDKVSEIPCTVRHLSVSVESMKKHKETICKLHHLRTVICIAPLMDDVSDVFHQILQNLKRLRVLYLSCYNSNTLPESVGELKHLRYLNLIKTLISELPTSLGTLYQLRILQLNYKVKILPDELCNLTKLRHLGGYDDRIGGSITKENEYTLPQVPNIGKLSSLQKLREFSVQRKKGYELGQLRDMNELGGSLRVRGLDNVTGKDEAIESKLHEKGRLTELELAWNRQNDTDADNNLHLDILECLMPPPQLKSLTIEGFKSATYPSWLRDGFDFENLEKFLSLGGCPLLTFITDGELKQHDQRQHMMRTDHLSSLLNLMRISHNIETVLREEHPALKQLMPLMDFDISGHLHTIESVLERNRDEVLTEENIIKAWLCCHEQRLSLIYGRIGRRTGQPLVPPTGLRSLALFSCSITDTALAICLSGLPSLECLSLRCIMTLTKLPSEEIFQHLTELERLSISSCWCLRSLGCLRACTSLSQVSIFSCPSLSLARGAEFMPFSLGELTIHNCILASDSFSNGLPHLKRLSMSECRSSATLPIGNLTSLESLSVGNFPDLCFLEGLSSLQLHYVYLKHLPKLNAECISQFHVKKSLYVSSSKVLNHMLSAEGFTVPEFLCLECCREPSVSFEKSAKLSSVKHLRFCFCTIKFLPTLKCFSSLEKLDIHSCPNISSLPDLPSSLKHICIWRCELLKKSCQAPGGESWPKIERIRWKEFRE
ncbi:unnamed protein product [Urochloa decumbens]|uniref:Rx N-terminal domain-containing protein n=1 Tax=Urochloa decumbens TaxID=240449 RepID=A0ABC8Z5X3_9POAL